MRFHKKQFEMACDPLQLTICSHFKFTHCSVLIFHFGHFPRRSPHWPQSKSHTCNDVCVCFLNVDFSVSVEVEGEIFVTFFFVFVFVFVFLCVPNVNLWLLFHGLDDKIITFRECFKLVSGRFKTKNLISEPENILNKGNSLTPIELTNLKKFWNFRGYITQNYRTPCFLQGWLAYWLR